MRYLPKFSDDYGQLAEDLSTPAVMTGDLEDLVEAYGDDWSLEDADELDLPVMLTH